MTHDSETTLAFLEEAMPPGTVLELRVFRGRFKNGYVVASDYNSVLSGWYDDPNALAVDAGRLRGVSGYLTFNPCNPDLLARACNKLAKSTHATKDEDITALRWLYIDIDPVRPADISSTDSELAEAMALRDSILATNSELAEASLSGSSGNGAWILSRLGDIPNDADGRKFIAMCLTILSACRSTSAVKIDVATKNPARVFCLPGSIKCKGSNIPHRPWRPVTFDWNEGPRR